MHRHALVFRPLIQACALDKEFASRSIGAFVDSEFLDHSARCLRLPSPRVLVFRLPHLLLALVVECMIQWFIGLFFKLPKLTCLPFSLFGIQVALLRTLASVMLDSLETNVSSLSSRRPPVLEYRLLHRTCVLRMGAVCRRISVNASVVGLGRSVDSLFALV